MFSEKIILIFTKDIGEDEDDYVNKLEDDQEQCYEDDGASSDIVITQMRNLDVKTAKAIYLNGGKSTFNTESRKARFFCALLF